MSAIEKEIGTVVSDIGSKNCVGVSSVDFWKGIFCNESKKALVYLVM